MAKSNSEIPWIYKYKHNVESNFDYGNEESGR